MITVLSHDEVNEPQIETWFLDVLMLTLTHYNAKYNDSLEPMGSEQDMKKNMPKITGSILRACKTYYDTPAKQLVQIISSITCNHYLENGNKRTAVSAGILYLISFYFTQKPDSNDMVDWALSKIDYLKEIADYFARRETSTEEMVEFAETNIFSTFKLN